MKVDRTKLTIKRLEDCGPEDDYVEGTPSERFAMVWPLTVRAWKFMDPNFDPDAPMRKDVARLYIGGKLVWSTGDVEGEDQ